MTTKAKRVCPISRVEFLTRAKPLQVKVGEAVLVAHPREFSTNSLGWYIGQKLAVQIGGQLVDCQVGISVTVIGSKELPIQSAVA